MFDLSTLGNFGLDLIHTARLRYRAQIAKLITLACDDLAHDTAHNLARARLGKVGDDVHLLGHREGADNFTNLKREFLVKSLLIVPVIFKFATKEGQKKKGSANICKTITSSKWDGGRTV
jgi:hypothetical protein